MTKTQPVRIQRKRTKGWDMQAASPNGLPVVYVGRPTHWGNPFIEGMWVTEYDYFFFWPVLKILGEKEEFLTASHSNAVDWYEQLVRQAIDTIGINLDELTGKNLACWCPLGQPCHADVLLELANEDMA